MLWPVFTDKGQYLAWFCPQCQFMCPRGLDGHVGEIKTHPGPCDGPLLKAVYDASGWLEVSELPVFGRPK